MLGSDRSRWKKQEQKIKSWVLYIAGKDFVTKGDMFSGVRLYYSLVEVPVEGLV